MKEIDKRNRPIKTVLKEYCERQKGKVVEARKELHERFEGLDWVIQKKIIAAHLQSSKSDREWVYPVLSAYWDVSFIPLVQELWETYYEEKCSWAIVRHFPKDYIMKHFDELCIGRNYFFFCLRFGNEPNFVVDKSKLKPLDILYICLHLKKSLDSDEACALLYEIAIDVILNYWRTDLDLRPSERGRIPNISPLRIRKLNQAFYYVSELHIDQAVCEFQDWCDKAQTVMMESSEWQQLQQMNLSDEMHNIRAYRIILKYIGIKLTDSILHKYIQKHPTLKDLSDKVKLEVNFDHLITELDEEY